MNRWALWPAAAVLTAVLSAVLPAALSAPPAFADPEPDSGKLVLVLDSSGSMKEPAGDGQTKIVAARTALTRVVGKLPEKAEVGLRVYGATVFKRSQPGACTDTQLTVPIGTGNRPQLRTAIAQYKPYGETPIGYSLQQAAKDLGPDGKRTIVLVSDGEATCAPEPCEVARSIAKQGIDLKIDVVGFRVGAKARSQLQCVAREGRGDYYDADSTEDLEAGLDRLSTRAFRPFRLSGKPVEGGPQQEGSPVLAPGHYSDTFGDDQTAKYYTIKRTIPKSTLRAGVSFRRPSGGSFVVQAEVKLKTLGGDQCGWSYPRAFEGDQGLATGTASSWSDWQESCSESEQMVLTISPGKDYKEIRGVPFELRINEEPPVADTTTLPEAADDPTWTSMPGATPTDIVPGSSFPDAPLLAPGSYKTTLMPGELQLYKVRLDWGQRIQAQVTVPKLGAATGKAVDGIRYLDTAVISPIGEDVYAVFAKEMPGGSGKRGVLTKEGVIQAITTKEIRYQNRDGANNQDTGTSTPGDYYVAVSLTRKPNDKAFTVPMTLTVGTVGTAGTGKPEYVDGATPVAGDSVTPSATPSEEQPTEQSSEEPSGDKTEAGGPVKDNGSTDDSGTPYGLIGGLGGAAVVLMLLGGWAVFRLRKKPIAAGPQYPGQQYPGQQYQGQPNPGQQHPGPRSPDQRPPQR
ncbi:Ca-activated chloride channel family protein [Kribbella amoyensis]|uniref:Ca-activated chloride channel family protein n=1 Tax=Kribbella amoyensis TaxID=996641 RepID=A0A561B7S7_9ACTN|nr:VWA domain-containing protein [Kribbella amoyensis]TWD75011.1 Ca-activated chloride channel family protein [Kribbella amoyensis]